MATKLVVRKLISVAVFATAVVVGFTSLMVLLWLVYLAFFVWTTTDMLPYWPMTTTLTQTAPGYFGPQVSDWRRRGCCPAGGPGADPGDVSLRGFNRDLGADIGPRHQRVLHPLALSIIQESSKGGNALTLPQNPLYFTQVARSPQINLYGRALLQKQKGLCLLF